MRLNGVTDATDRYTCLDSQVTRGQSYGFAVAALRGWLASLADLNHTGFVALGFRECCAFGDARRCAVRVSSFPP